MKNADGKKRTGRRVRRVILSGFILTALGLYLFWEKLPYQNEASRQLQKFLASYHITVTSLHVDSLSSSHAVISGIQLGTPPGLKIGNAAADYSLSEIRKGRVKNIAIDGAAIEIYEENKAWKIGGLESATFPASSDGSSFNIFDNGSMQSKMPDEIVLTNSSIHLLHPSFETNVPLAASYKNQPSPAFTADISALALSASNYTVNANKIALKTALKDGAWKGTLNAPTLQLGGLPQDIPPLKLSSTFTASVGSTRMDASLEDKTKAYFATLSLYIPTDAPKTGSLVIKSLQFPYASGLVRTSSLKIPLAGNKPIKVSLEFDNLSLESLAALTSDGKVKATGAISGTLPLTYYPDGRITLQEGSASAKESGTIIVSPDAIPGGEQKELEVVRTAMQNFHYTSLSLRVLSGADDTSTIHLTVEGNNPEAFNGKPVKLNINLSGDILPMIQQSLGALNDVKSLLKNEGK